MSTPTITPVVVVGAGPTGVTAATLLAKYGVEVIVLDRFNQVYPQPRAVHLDDEIHRIVARLGLGEKFAGISRPSQGLRLLDADHGVMAEFSRDASTGRHGYPQANMFDQPDLEALLRDNMSEHPMVTFRGDVEVIGVHQPAEGPIRIEVSDRSTGRAESLHARFVLGCDGANSVVRQSMGARMRDLRFQQRWLVVDVNTDHDLHQWEGVHQVCDTSRAATYMRISDRRHRWEFQLHDGEMSADYEHIRVLLPLIQPWTGDVPADDLEIVRVAEYTFRAQVADRWRDRNVFILGDAAHLTPPFIGQGMGAGLRDADNLSWKLAHVLDGSLPESLLETYEAERRPHTLHMIRLAMTVGTLMTRGGRAGDVLRRLIAPRLHLVPGVRDKLLDSATPGLRRTALVRRRRRPGGLAGSLCPNVLVSSAGRFDAAWDGRFALVTSRPAGPAVQAKVEQAGVRLLETHQGEPLCAWLNAGKVRAALVRPDGTVMVAASTAQQALRALDGLAVDKARG